MKETSSGYSLEIDKIISIQIDDSVFESIILPSRECCFLSTMEF